MNAIRVFVTIAREESVTAAAKAIADKPLTEHGIYVQPINYPPCPRAPSACASPRRRFTTMR